MLTTQFNVSELTEGNLNFLEYLGLPIKNSMVHNPARVLIFNDISQIIKIEIHSASGGNRMQDKMQFNEHVEILLEGRVPGNIRQRGRSPRQNLLQRVFAQSRIVSKIGG